MRKIFFSLSFLLLSSLNLLAQAPSPTVSPKPAENDESIVKISTSLIQIDVTVTDKEGKIVRDLKPEDFEVYENKERQDIKNFSFVSSESPAPVRKTVGKNEISVPIPPAPMRAEQVRRTIALVVDDLQTSSESLVYVRRSLRKFVDEQMQPNDLVTIIRTGVGIGISQQFTNDKRQLYAAIDNIKCNLRGRGCLPDSADFSEAPASSNVTMGSSPIKENEFDSFREDVIAVGTLGTVRYVINGMKEMPGRKSIMFFSDGFSFEVVHKDRTSKVFDTLRRLTELANRSSVTIYSFDARGLIAALPAEVKSFRERQKGLAFLADETGGRKFFDSNDLNEGLEKALAEQQGFYLIGYQPDAETFDATARRFNKLEIKVKRPGLNVRYRSGFFGVADTPVADAERERTPSQQILGALASPFAANGIKLQLNTVFGNNEKSGSFVHSFLHIDAKELKFTDEPGGWKKAIFDILAISFSEDGVPIDQINNTHTFTVKADAYQKVLDKGFVYNFIFPVKQPGAYQMRVAVRDTVTSKVGAASLFIEVPNLKKDQLTLSGAILENLNAQQWQASQSNQQISLKTDPLADTSLRRFKKGTVLRYGLDIYNAKLDRNQQANLRMQIKVFRDGKLIMEGKPNPLNAGARTSTSAINFIGALNLGQEMTVGEYVMQVIVTDSLAKSKRSQATQLIQFEVTD